MPRNDIVFTVTPCRETGGYVARWDDLPERGGISTQGETLSELEEMIADAVSGYFESADRPRKVKLHFIEDPVLAL
jgi:predicted RNase H-like HicB family nuclease